MLHAYILDHVLNNGSQKIKNWESLAEFGLCCRLIAKYRPSVPVLAVVIPRLKTNPLTWTLTGTVQVPQVALPKF